MKANVYFNKEYQLFHARIYLGNKKYFHVGRYRTKEAADAKAEEMLQKLKGEPCLTTTSSSPTTER